MDFVEEPEVVRLDGLVIEIGVGAPNSKVLACAYRHYLGKLGPVDEAELARCVAQHGRGPANTREAKRQSAVG